MRERQRSAAQALDDERRFQCGHSHRVTNDGTAVHREQRHLNLRQREGPAENAFSFFEAIREKTPGPASISASIRINSLRT
jgi:hypothetical protein